jgi:hypothetical protein
LESGLKLEQVEQDCLYAGGEKKYGKQQHQYKAVMNGFQISSLT